MNRPRAHRFARSFSQLLLTAALWGGLVACDKQEQPQPLTGLEAACAGAGQPSVTLGYGVGGAFVELVDGEPFPVTNIYQAGFGVRLKVRTTGLETEEHVLVTVRSEIDGKLSASETFEDEGGPFTYLFCDDHGQGVITNIDITFDPTIDNVTELAGVKVDLFVEVQDGRGVSAATQKSVVIAPGN